MKTQKFFFLGAALLMAASCALELIPDEEQIAPEVNLVPVTFSVGSDTEDTKVYLGGENFKSVLWSSDDKIKVFDRTTNVLSAFSVTGGYGTTSAVISGSISTGATTPYFAMYPYQESAVYTASNVTVSSTTISGGCITMNIPNVQKAVAGSVDPSAFLGIAKCTDGKTFNFKNVTAFVKFQLNSADVENLETITYSGNNFNSIAGNIYVGFTETNGVTQTYAGDMKDYITLTKPDEGWESGVNYFIAIRAALKFASGFTITAKYSDGTYRHLTTSYGPKNDKNEDATISRNYIMNLGSLPSMTSGLPSNLYIAYRQGHDIDVAGVKINSKNNGTARLVSTSSADTELDFKTGVTFLQATGEGTYKISSELTANSDTYLIGLEKNSVNITVSKSFKHTKGTLAFKNLNMDVSSITNQVVSNYGANVDCDKFIVDGCKVSNMAASLYAINGGNNGAYKPFTCKDFIINDSDFQIKVTTSEDGNTTTASNVNNGIINLSNTTSTNTNSIAFNNCIYYCTKNATGKIINLPTNLSSYKETISFNNNTIFNIHAGSNVGLLHVQNCASLEMKDNIFSFYGINSTNNEYIIYNTTVFTINQSGNQFHKRNSSDKYKMYLYKYTEVSFSGSAICETEYPYTSKTAGIGATRTSTETLSSRQTWTGASGWTF